MNEIKAITPKGKEILIDEAIAPIIKNFWMRGINTRFSCAGHPAYEDMSQTYIIFPLKDAKAVYESMIHVSKFTSLRNFNISLDIRKKQFQVEALSPDYRNWLENLANFNFISEFVKKSSGKFDPSYWANESNNPRHGMPIVRFALFVTEIPDSPEADANADFNYLSKDKIESAYGEFDMDDSLEFIPSFEFDHETKITPELIMSLENNYSPEQFDITFGC